MLDVLGGDSASVLADFGSHSASEVAPVSTMATAMLFGTVIFSFVALSTQAYLSQDLRAFKDAQNPRATGLNVRSFSSVYTLLHHMTVFGLILFYAYLCVHHPPFPHAGKSYDRDEFFFMTALLFFASAYTLAKNDKSRKVSEKQNGNGNNVHEMTAASATKEVEPVNDANEVLNRDQTEEWKGWMQFMFLLYHYYHAEEVYNAIRVMITCYVWMTGFGNFSFFYLKGDYSAVRVLQMLWRLNFLVVFLCLSQGTTYILYYICLLHTYFFLMVYVTMRIVKRVNYTKWGIRIKMLVLAGIIFVMWDVDTGIFRLVHSPFLGETPMLGATFGSMWEWYFRSSLDHWSTFLGMVFALNFPITSLFYRKLEAQPPVWNWLGKIAMGMALFGVFCVWVTGPFQQAKREYNATNAYFGIVPLLTYIYFRNLTPWLRSHSLDLLHQIGKTTLETYLMQHHIWLTSNAKSLLTLIPGWPKINMLVVSITYFYLSRRLYRLTLFLRGMILPDDRNKCLRNLGFLVGIITAFYALAVALKSAEMLTLFAIGLVSVTCGTVLYNKIMDSSWEGSKDSSNNAVDGNSTRSSSTVVPPFVGTMAVLVLGLVWQGMAQKGAAVIQPLPQGCESFVNHGAWIPVDGCNEESRGTAYRQYGISAYGTCMPESKVHVWGWNATESASHCRFVHRDAASLRKALKGRTITFVGDSISRHIYHATVRALGVVDAGAYNTNLPKWSDMNRTVSETTVEFEWAPYSRDLVPKLQNITKRPLKAMNGDDAIRPDLVIIGGGAWDRLHVYNTTEERASHRKTLQDLAKEIRRVRSENIPVAWIVPTAINSNALLTEDKRVNMNEEEMKTMRSSYVELGVVDAANFVLDGPAFTNDRVPDSYDGVHYPLVVYDAAAQILANAMDWLLPERDTVDLITIPQPGAMANPRLGLIMVAFVLVGLFLFDGFMGFSYLAGLFVQSVRPVDLYEEAFTSLHTRKKLPPIDCSRNVSSSISMARLTRVKDSNEFTSDTNGLRIKGDEETAALMGST